MYLNFLSFTFSTKDMREKFSFLRRRHTDTSLSGQDSNGKGKPTPEAALHWSKSFENLIVDKCKYLPYYISINKSAASLLWLALYHRS